MGKSLKWVAPLAVLAAGMLLVSCAAAAKTTTTATTTIKVGANQSLVIGRITDIKGNDLALALVKETTVTAGQTGSNGQTTASGQTGQTMASGQAGQGGQRQRPTGSDPSGQAGQTFPSGQQGQGGQRQRPSGSDQSGQTGQTAASGQTAATGQTAASGQTASGQTAATAQSGQTSATGRATGTGTGTAASQQATVIFTLTGESLTTRIPVGVKVTTAKGAVTTFSRLAVGDMVKILLENSGGTQVPVAVWIVG